MNYDVDYFINKVASADDSRLGVCLLEFCINGYCGVKFYSVPTDEATELGNILSVLFDKRIDPKFIHFDKYVLNLSAYINDGQDIRYQQPNPKQRILAALQDVKAKQQPQYTDITKELAVLPVEETPDKINIPQLVN